MNRPQQRALAAGLSSMVWATMVTLGVSEAVKGPVPLAALILGYGVGSYVVVKWRR